MCKQKTVIFGVGAIADIVYDSIVDDTDTEIEVAAFCVDKEYHSMTEKYGLPVVNFDEVKQRFSPQEYKMIIAVGYQKLNKLREERCRQAEKMGYTLSGFIHSQADISSSVKRKIGRNPIIVKNVSIGPEAAIGNNVCLFAGTVISHHTVVEDNVWMAPGSVICGRTIIGENTFIGANSTIGDNLNIGKNNFIGAGTIITKDTENDAVYIVPNTTKYVLNSDQFTRMFGT